MRDTGRERSTERCPNCGHEMIRVRGIWVCPECEYHSDVDPERGSFR